MSDNCVDTLLGSNQNSEVILKYMYCCQKILSKWKILSFLNTFCWFTFSTSVINSDQQTEQFLLCSGCADWNYCSTAGVIGTVKERVHSKFKMFTLHFVMYHSIVLALGQNSLHPWNSRKVIWIRKCHKTKWGVANWWNFNFGRTVPLRWTNGNRTNPGEKKLEIGHTSK